MRNFRLQMLIEATMLAAAAMVLDLLPSIKIASGISISFAMVPVFVAALRWGHKAGFPDFFGEFCKSRPVKRIFFTLYKL